MLRALKEGGVPEPYRVVDIGCGTGYVIRWLTAKGKFDVDVKLLGVDFNAGLVREANRLSRIENLDCQFEVANAFTLDQPATVFVSTGVIHHFRGDVPRLLLPTT